jgi:regulatory Crp family protein
VTTIDWLIRAICGAQDIADYLGLTIEIGSRTLALLVSAATIEVPTSLPIV